MNKDIVYRKQRQFFVLFVVSVCLSLFFILSDRASAGINFAGGSGTQSDPYQIATADQLTLLGNYLGLNYKDAYFKITANIDLNVAPYNTAAGWTPIGTSNNSFYGNLDGGGHTISNLAINNIDDTARGYGSAGTNYGLGIGLFGSVSGYVKNLNLSNYNITVANPRTFTYTGGLAGINNGRVTNVVVSGSVSGGYHYSGGLIGENGGFITACSASSTVSGAYYTGGVTGQNTGSIARAFFNGAVVDGGNMGGGIAGASNNNIADSYAIGSCSVGSGCGGLVGYNPGTINRSYAVMAMTGLSGQTLVNLIGPGSVNSSFWNSDVSVATTTSGGGTGKTTAEMKSQTTYSDWDFSSVWDISPSVNSGYPFLRPVSFPSSPANFSVTDVGGDSVGFTWDLVNANPAVSEYDIYYTLASSTNWAVERDTNYSNNSFSLSSLNSGADYAIKIAAVNLAGLSDFSTTVLFTTLTNGVPAVPGGLSASVSSRSANLKWTAVSAYPSLQDYKIRYRPTASSDWTVITDNTVSTSTYALSGLTAATDYEFQVAAENSVGSSAFSASAYFTTAQVQTRNISDCESLQAINEHPEWAGDTFVLTSSINCGTVNGTGVFSALGTGWSSPFGGEFDGNNFTISNLTVGTTDNEYQGLFGTVSGAIIKNLNLDNVNITGEQYVGALAGYMQSGSAISNVHATGTVTSLFENSGGLIGVNELGTVTGSGAHVDVHSNGAAVGSYHLSQLVSGNWEEKYQQNYPVKYQSFDYAFTPENNRLSLRIVQEHVPFGDIDQIKLTACGQMVNPAYAKYVSSGKDVTDDISAIDKNVIVNHNMPIEVSWEISASCQQPVTVSMYANEYGPGTPALFVGSYTAGQQKNYTAYWMPSTGHPDGNNYIAISDDADNVYFNLDITSDNSDDYGDDWTSITIGGKTFKITDSAQTWGSCVFGLSDKVNYKHQLCSFIIPKTNIGKDSFDFTLRYYGTMGYFGVGGLEGLHAGGSVSNSFASGGVYGSNFIISVGGLIGLALSPGYAFTVSSSSAFGLVNAGDRGNYVGGLVGMAFSDPTVITGSSASGDVTGSTYVGGLAGVNYFAAINHSYSQGNVSGYNSTGGLVGGNNGSVSTSYATGNVTGSENSYYAGGLIGQNNNSAVNNTYATGNVSGGVYVGGLIGEDIAEAPQSINNSYSIGDVSGQDFVGGFIGYNIRDDINNSFSTGNALSSRINIGGFVGNDSENDQTLYQNNFWSNGLDSGIGGFSGGSINSVSGRWDKAASAEIFKGSGSVAPFNLNGEQKWSTDVWQFTAGSYPQLVGILVQSTTTPADNPVSVSQPAISNNGGAVIVITPGIGTGSHDITAAGVGAAVSVGDVTASGTNVLTYVTNQNNFRAPESASGWNLGNHSFQITNLDLSAGIAVLTFSSKPITITLKKGESVPLDLDEDKTSDVQVTFANIYVNRAEITIKSLRPESAVSGSGNVSFTPSVAFTRLLKQGMTGLDVKQLQVWLNAHGFIVAAKGAGSPGNETEVFGPATKKALIQMQKHYQLKPYPGYTGPQTREVLNKQ